MHCTNTTKYILMRNKKWSVLSLRYHESSLVGMHEERWVLWAETRHTGSVGISVLCFAQPVLCHNSENCNTVNCWTVCNKHFQVPSLLNKSIFSRYSSDFLIYCFFFSFLNCFHYREMIEISLITTCLKCYFFFFCCSCEALQFQILQGFCNLVFLKK